ncbi:hypothetical protein R50073_16690 [Maricurvus nonylphenolicus]|uniref:hypothetical protein n=1 Tax=Maricurvus nonylphenolicus TaxID=1008307 RepID=UPI0036F3BB7F
MNSSVLPNTPPPHFLQDQVVAGKSSGVTVLCVPAVKPVYDNLVTLSDKGNHWARLAVNGIHSLNAGRLHLQNVFIKSNKSVAYGNGEFFVVLPGCRVTVEKLDSGKFKIVNLEADTNYFQLQKRGEKPALHEVTKDAGVWKAKILPEAKIDESTDRMVCVTDKGHGHVNDAANNTAPYIVNSPLSIGGTRADDRGFDMHFTPGPKKIGGLINARQAQNPETDSDLHESAILLAKTMYDARDIEGVCWISEFGGSGVLTQAMKILVQQGVKLENHYIFMHRPTTSLNKAYTIANDLKLKVERSMSKSNLLNPNDLVGGVGVFGNFAHAIQRYRSEKNYSLLNAGSDLIASGNNMSTAVNTGATVAGALAVTAGGSVGSIAAVPAVASFLAAFAVVKGTASLGSTLVEAYLPHRHAKIKSKF